MNEKKKHIMFKYAFSSFLIFLLTLSVDIQAQESSSYVKINQDEAISNLLKKHIIVNEYNPWVSGFRVQLYSISGANSRDKANQFRAEFLIKHPKTQVYVVYQAPYYKVRLGDFRTKMNALYFLQTIVETYPSGFVVVDQIRFMDEEKQNSDG